jgi:hypothetical protein
MSLKDKNVGEYPHRMMIDVHEDGSIKVPELTLDRPSCDATIGHVSPYYKDVFVRQDTEGISDGYHTFDELYKDRLLLTALLFEYMCGGPLNRRTHKPQPFKSKLHHDDTMFDGMFIVGIMFGDRYFSYHYNLEYWDLFHFMPEIHNAPKWSKEIDMTINEFFMAVTVGFVLNKDGGDKDE